MHNLWKCQNETHPLMLLRPLVLSTSYLAYVLTSIIVVFLRNMKSILSFNLLFNLLAVYLKMLSLVNINLIVILKYKKTLKKKHNKQKVICKLWTDEHIKNQQKNLQFLDPNSSWKTSNLQFCHHRTESSHVWYKLIHFLCY
jgi:hypothetical protein